MTSTTTPIDDELGDLDLPICLNIQPPPGSLKTASKRVFAMPLTSPWLAHRYRKDVIEQRKEGEELMSLPGYIHQLHRNLSTELQKIVGTVVKTEFAKTSHSDGFVNVFVVGRPGRIPTREAIYEVVEVFDRYDVVEELQWFPLYYVFIDCLSTSGELGYHACKSFMETKTNRLG